MTYSTFKFVGVKQADPVICLLLRADNKTQDVHFKTLVPYLADLLVRLAMNLAITVPGFIILLGLARSVPYLRIKRDGV